VLVDVKAMSFWRLQLQ